jgi:TetR/AcrR family transcriptional repressor of nem operon
VTVEAGGSHGETPDPENAADFADAYLATRHRNDKGGGCPIAGLGSEAARAPAEVRATLTLAIRRQIDRFSRASPGATSAARRRAAMATWSAMVGAVVLARIVDDDKLSGEILSAPRASIALN